MAIGNKHYIINEQPDKDRYIQKDREETNYKSSFSSLTNQFQPTDMMDRNMYKAAFEGKNVLDEHVNRLERMIEARGEYVVLVRRILDDDYCSCYNPSTKEIRRKYCLECYGTRIIGGYKRFVNKDREDGRIIVAKPFSDQELNWEEWGRDWKEEMEYWTVPWIPLTTFTNTTLESYDFIVRYNEAGEEMDRGYITSFKPSEAKGNKVTYQKMAVRLAQPPTYKIERDIKVLDRRGDILYEVPIDKLATIIGSKP